MTPAAAAPGSLLPQPFGRSDVRHPDPSNDVAAILSQHGAQQLEAVAVAMRAWMQRFGPTSPWPLMVWITGGLLRAPPRPWPAV